MTLTKEARKNREYWDRISDKYQMQHGQQLSKACAWGTWAIPDEQVGALGDVHGKDVLELGSGAAQWSIFLAKRGARAVALDNSAMQLVHARRLMQQIGLSLPLIHASAETLPFPPASFDLVFSDWGALPHADPRLVVPEAARVLRSNGLLVFNMSTPIRDLCWSTQTRTIEARLHANYFDLYKLETDEKISYQLPYGEWIRLFRSNSLLIEDLIELRPDPEAETAFDGWSLDWARRWPGEHIWKVRKS